MQQLILRQDWQRLAADHSARLRRWTEPFRARRRTGQSHPVHDFLFVYYQFSPAKLEQWHPGMGVILDSAAPDRDIHGWHSDAYRRHGQDLVCDPQLMDAKSWQRLQWIENLLRQTAGRRPNFACHGLHEWAMVYQGQEVRHERTTPLRLSQSGIDAVVESRPIRCTHFDAFRFFADQARPLNRWQPGLEDRPELEQPACIHANMDLYKWAFKAMPWIGSELLADCFDLALRARAVDMRASPYDLSGYGDYPPIPIETEAGRAEYEIAQRGIRDAATPLRARLIAAIEAIRSAVAVSPG